MAKLIEGYNMLIWENEDGTATYTGSFNRAEWDAYLAKSGKKAAPDVPSGEPTKEPDADAIKEPAGNASTDEWREFALAQGASEDDVADLSRNELREQFGSEES